MYSPLHFLMPLWRLQSHQHHRPKRGLVMTTRFSPRSAILSVRIHKWCPSVHIYCPMYHYPSITFRSFMFPSWNSLFHLCIITIVLCTNEFPLYLSTPSSQKTLYTFAFTRHCVDLIPRIMHHMSTVCHRSALFFQAELETWKRPCWVSWHEEPPRGEALRRHSLLAFNYELKGSSQIKPFLPKFCQTPGASE